MSELPRIATSTGTKFSLARDTQLRTYLESLGNEANLTGVLSGGGLIDNGGVSVIVPAGVYASKGVVKETTADTTYNGLGATAVSYLFGRVVRTAASPQSDMTALDTYALSIDSNTTGALPAADVGWFRLGVVETSGGDIIRLEFKPDFVPVAGGPPLFPTEIAHHRTYTVWGGSQAVVYGSLLIQGTLQVFGNLRVLEGS
jgi:hypothetical protein